MAAAPLPWSRAGPSGPEAEGTYSSVIMSAWGCFMCLAMAASASSTYSSFSESETFCRAESRCSGCRPSCSRARSCESHKKGAGRESGQGLSGHSWDGRDGRRGASDGFPQPCPASAQVPAVAGSGHSCAQRDMAPAQPRGEEDPQKGKS